VQARAVLKDELPRLPDGVRLSVMDVRGYDLRLHREWDRLRGTLQTTGEAIEVDIPRLSAWSVFGPLFGGAGMDPTALPAAAAQPSEDMLEIWVNDAERRRHDDQSTPASMEECLTWLRALGRTDGNFLVLCGRSGGVVQMMWQDGPGSKRPRHDEPRLWLETPEPGLGRSRGRYVTPAEAEEMITILARADRVAVDDLGKLEHREFVEEQTRHRHP
jgi:hypothetical protein